MRDHGQIEVRTNDYTDTLYAFCGFDGCRSRILSSGLGIKGDVSVADEFDLSDDGDEVIVTVRRHLDKSDSCVWCVGCGEFLRHANASLEPDGTFFGCECESPEEDREALRPMVMENGRLELRHFN